LGAEQRGTVVLVALRITTGDGDIATGQRRSRRPRAVSELVEEVQQVVGVLAGDIKADDEGSVGVALRQQLQTLAELRVASGPFGEGQLGSGGLKVVAQEGGVVTITRGVDANADAAGGTACPFRSSCCHG